MVRFGERRGEGKKKKKKKTPQQVSSPGMSSEAGGGVLSLISKREPGAPPLVFRAKTINKTETNKFFFFKNEMAALFYIASLCPSSVSKRGEGRRKG